MITALKKTLSVALLSSAVFLGACTQADALDSSLTTTAVTATASTESDTTESSNTTDTTDTAAIADAAEAFFATLSPEEANQATYDYDDSSKSTMWSNFPITFIERSGVTLMDLTDTQQEAAMALIKASVNEETYTLIENIMNGDQYLVDYANTQDMGNTHYNIAIFGDPTSGDSWSIQFGGHHLGLNIDINPTTGEVTYAPTHFGSQPTVYTNDSGETVETFDAIYSDAFAFYDSLDESQLSEMYQGEEVSNMFCSPGSTCDYPTGTGIQGSELTDEQKQLPLELISNWAVLGDDDSVLDTISASLDDTYINWSGATTYDLTSGSGIYFQISGPDVYIEFASQNNDAGATIDGVTTAGWGHVHTIYRDPNNDYAGSVEQEEGSGPGLGGQMPPAILQREDA